MAETKRIIIKYPDIKIIVDAAGNRTITHPSGVVVVEPVAQRKAFIAASLTDGKATVARATAEAAALPTKDRDELLAVATK